MYSENLWFGPGVFFIRGIVLNRGKGLYKYYMHIEREIERERERERTSISSKHTSPLLEVGKQVCACTLDQGLLDVEHQLQAKGRFCSL